LASDVDQPRTTISEKSEEATMNTRVIDIDRNSFDTLVLQATEPVLVDFWGSWCPPCKIIAPIVEDLATHYQGRLRVVKVNVDYNPDLVGRCGVTANPSLLFFKQGREVQRLVGAWPRAKIVAAVDQVLATAVS
jgi:thioredoxin